MSFLVWFCRRTGEEDPRYKESAGESTCKEDGNCMHRRYMLMPDIPHTSQWAGDVPPKLGSRPEPNTWFLGLTRVRAPNGISIGSAVFAQLIVVSDQETDRHTDHATSVATDRIRALHGCVPQCSATILLTPFRQRRKH